MNEGRGEAPPWWSAAPGSILRRVGGTGRIFEGATGPGVREDERKSVPKPSAGEIADEIRTFLVAEDAEDTSLTHQPVDEPAARVAARFAEIVRSTVNRCISNGSRSRPHPGHRGRRR
jgi:hypothetical protein